MQVPLLKGLVRIVGPKTYFFTQEPSFRRADAAYNLQVPMTFFTREPLFKRAYAESLTFYSFTIFFQRKNLHLEGLMRN
jgi:hypothetical protein